MTRRPVSREGLLLSLLAAVLLLLAQPPFQFILLPFTALVPLVLAVRTSGNPAWYGLAFGLLYWGVLLFWVPLEVAPRFSWAYPGYLAQVGLLAGLTALMAWCTQELHGRVRIPLFLAFPLAWVGMEWLKAHFPFGLSFPWLGLGITLTAWPELLGIAEWTGESGVAFWLASVNALLASAVTKSGGRSKETGSWMKRATRLRLLSLAVVAAVLPALLGLLRARTLPLLPGPRVAVVGTGVPASVRLLPEEGSSRALAEVEKILAGLPPGAVDLVVLPEAVVAFPLNGDSARDFRDRLARLARGVDAPLLVGALGRGEDPAFPTNSAFLLDAQGTVRSRYDKSRLVPGMERSGYRAGVPGFPLVMGGFALGPLICYESIFSGLSRRYGEGGADLLVNLTSDVWFGHPGAWPGRSFLAQHPAHLVMRAAETRMGVARAANGGYSLLLDPLGRALTPPLPPGPGMALSDIPRVEGPTLFSRIGDITGLLALVLVVALALPGRLGSIRTSMRSLGSGSQGPPAG